MDTVANHSGKRPGAFKRAWKLFFTKEGQALYQTGSVVQTVQISAGAALWMWATEQLPWLAPTVKAVWVTAVAFAKGVAVVVTAAVVGLLEILH